MVVSGSIVDVHSRSIYKAQVTIKDGRIFDIKPVDNADDVYILPGMIDAHVHIESSMMSPQGFSELAIKHGTIAAVADPHEIANVLGVQGVEFMLENSKQSPLKIFFGAPSCVPATPFETSGAVLNISEIRYLLQQKQVVCLAEMMNFPGVINNENIVLGKIKVARELNKPIDGHAPGLHGADLDCYIAAGISTDHEAVDIWEAEEKIRKGMIIQIREGSAAKNFDDLLPLVKTYTNKLMFCSDDSHPDTLENQHILHLIKRGLDRGYDIFDLLTVAVLVPTNHYKLPVGTLKPSDPADFIIIDNLKEMNVLSVYINGLDELSSKPVKTVLETPHTLNKFNVKPISKADISVPKLSNKIRIISAKDKELYTGSEIVELDSASSVVCSDTQNDILKLAVLNRYKESKPQLAFIRGFGLKHGAIASSIAHDSHNIIAVGVADKDIVNAINKLIEIKGGLVAYSGNTYSQIPLEIAGLMTNEAPEKLIRKYDELKGMVQRMGTCLDSPFMTLSFMALPVIPELKLTDTGLFDVNTMSFTDLFV